MKQLRPALILLAVQIVIVLSIAGKYLYERKTCPRIWVRSAQYDPNLPLRGRYLALQLVVDGCALPRNAAHFTDGFEDAVGMKNPGFWRWTVSLHAVDGKLVPILAAEPHKPGETEEVTLWPGGKCDRLPVSNRVEYFIPDRAKPPFPLKKGEELWVEVTIPPSGPPRPIQIALSSSDGFHPLKFD